MESTSDLEFDVFQKSSRWLAENFDDLREKFRGKFVAVKEDEIIADADSFLELKEKLEKDGISLATVFVDYIPPKELVVFL